MEKYFPGEKIRLTGNPIRKALLKITEDHLEAYAYYHLNPGKKTVLITGGSLGAKTLNNSVVSNIKIIASNPEIQWLWQCGSHYHDQLHNELKEILPKNVHLMKFIERMDFAYSVADIIISRAGAISISELCLIGKPAILVPSPNVAEDHQTKNAQALVSCKAALLVKDQESEKKLISTLLEVLNDENTCRMLSENIRKLAKPEATKSIVDELEKIASYG
jgi:UDP-N-acetylglucosamine--N-acetylmuramyl-(pentapeptide) pyrophosphoryl-undecaprenol N-acetylglucosamine transferase